MNRAAMLWLYRLLFAPALLVLAPLYLQRMRRRGGYRSHFGHRFGDHPVLPAKRPGVRRVWLQAVSVGEMLAIAPVLEALHRDGVEVYLTTTTSTGYQLARDRYGALTVGIGYFPIDWAPFSARAWRRIDPDLVILTEGERWPEHLEQARRRGVPVLSINARLSDRSFARLRRLRPAAHLMLRGITRLLPCSAHDAARFRELGAPPEIITTTGNLKLDVQIPLLEERERAQLRRELGLPEGLVLLGSSTWPGEEAALLNAWKTARQSGISCALLVVPRHAERRGDTTGELRKFTQLADLVFVGKSLPPHTEGQTPVEAAALEKPILFGSGMSNFRMIARDLLARGAAREVPDAAALEREVTQLLRDPTQRAALATAAGKWRRENSGAVLRTLAVIREELARL